MKNLDEKEALENGWLFCRTWYPCRSVRIRISDYVQKNMKYESEYIPHTSPAVTNTVSRIYEQYLEYKKFDERYNVFTDLGRTSWLILKDEGEPIAFTKFNLYGGGIESQFTAWNYHRPKLSIGKSIVDYEVDIARMLGHEYLYIGQGYETGSKYKSDFKGFEWWTGSEWSTDKKEYNRLCARDSEINTIKQLAEVYSETCQSLDPVESTS